MEAQKIINFLNNSSIEESKFDTKNVIDSQNNNNNKKYKQRNYIEFEKETTKSSLCNFCDAFILVTGDIKVNAVNVVKFCI